MRGRFKCIRKDGIESFTVVLEPVYSGPEDRFFVDVPHGTVAMGPLTKEAAAVFVVGEECFADFAPKVEL